MSDTTIVVKKVISAPRNEVFEAFTDADIMSAEATKADVYAFNVKPAGTAASLP